MAKIISSPIRWQYFSLFLLAVLLSGCGLTQKVVDGTKGVTKAIFYKQIKTLHLDFSPRTSMNTDEGDQSSLATNHPRIRFADSPSIWLRGQRAVRSWSVDPRNKDRGARDFWCAFAQALAENTQRASLEWEE